MAHHLSPCERHANRVFSPGAGKGNDSLFHRAGHTSPRLSPLVKSERTALTARSATACGQGVSLVWRPRRVRYRCRYDFASKSAFLSRSDGDNGRRARERARPSMLMETRVGSRFARRPRLALFFPPPFAHCRWHG